jgi:anti-sigma regulatory factor (Ser/Thr protein kinase)
MGKLLGIGALAKALNLHENTIRNWSNSGKIPFELTPGGQRRFDLEKVRSALGRPALTTWSKIFSLAALEEDVVWGEIKSTFGITGKEPAADIAVYAFTEMLNNAIDHSLGAEAHITFTISDEMWSFEIIDDGVGVLGRIQEKFKLDSPLEAVGELTKGKRTTAPEAHTGEGIFFTSKMVAKFSIESQCIQWSCDNLIDDFSILASDVDSGTRVRCEVLTAPRWRALDIFERFSSNHEFTKSRPVIKLFELGTDFVSRSEAKRLVSGLENFKEVDLDFAKVKGIGQGFADQVFRVWQKAHPETRLHVINASAEVRFMIDRANGVADGNL